MQVTFYLPIDRPGVKVDEVKVTANVIGGYRPATFWEPAEGPEIIDICPTLMGMEVLLTEAELKRAHELAYEAWKDEKEAEAELRLEAARERMEGLL